MVLPPRCERITDSCYFFLSSVICYYTCKSCIRILEAILWLVNVFKAQLTQLTDKKSILILNKPENLSKYLDILQDESEGFKQVSAYFFLQVSNLMFVNAEEREVHHIASSYCLSKLLHQFFERLGLTAIFTDFFSFKMSRNNLEARLARSRQFLSNYSCPQFCSKNPHHWFGWFWKCKSCYFEKRLDFGWFFVWMITYNILGQKCYFEIFTFG